MFEEDAGRGMENMGQEDLALPFIKILSGLGTNSDTKQKRSKALPLGESMTSEAQPIGSAVGG